MNDIMEEFEKKESSVIKLLDAKGINYRLLYHNRSVFTCEEAAKERGVLLSEMIKCILLVDKDENYFLACVPSDKKVYPQKVRELMNCKRLSFASKEEIEEVLGYTMGAIPPLLLKNDVPIIFDNEIINKERVNICTGNPKAGLELNSKDLIGLINPKFGDITK